MPWLSIDGITFPDVSYTGPAIDPEEWLTVMVPEPLRGWLRQTNGWVALNGALHVRGVCVEPFWHSVMRVSLLRDYAGKVRKDLPFAQDCLGNHFVLRGAQVLRLDAETGRWDDLKMDIRAFFCAALDRPEELLNARLLRERSLAPGELLLAYPPLCTKQALAGPSLKAVPALEVQKFHADLYRQIRDLPAGASIEFKVTD